MAHVLVTLNTHLLLDLLLHLLQVGSQVQVHLVLGAQQSLQHLISRHAHFSQDWLLELALQILHLDLEVFNLERECKRQQNDIGVHILNMYHSEKDTVFN